MEGFKNINIKNFRGIEHLEVDDFSRVNVFLGQNNAGKSSVLECLLLLMGMSNPDLPQNVNSIRTRRFSGFSDLRSLNETLARKLQNLGITTLLFMKTLEQIEYRIGSVGVELGRKPDIVFHGLLHRLALDWEIPQSLPVGMQEVKEINLLPVSFRVGMAASTGRSCAQC